MAKPWHHVLMLLLLIQGAFAVPCTEDDVLGEYSVCQSNKRDAFYRWRPDTTCNPQESGSVTLPEPKLDLRCDIPCDAGFFLPVGESECAACTPGTHSLGGGVVIEHWEGQDWDTFSGLRSGKVRFRSWCEANHNQPYKFGTVLEDDCPGWQFVAGGSQVESGEVDSLKTSVLEAEVRLVRDGEAVIAYEVSAEPAYDGLVVVVDRQIAKEEVALPLKSTTERLTELTIPLTAGTHTIQFRYYKDLAISGGEDLASLRHFRVEGLDYADSACTKCPKGFHQPESQQTECVPCGRDTFAAGLGASTCDTCDSSQYALIGAVKCTDRDPCTTDDYQFLFGGCVHDESFVGNNGGDGGDDSGPRSRKKKYAWIEPRLCDPQHADSVALPQDEDVACLACNGGTVRQTATQDGVAVDCEPCPVGRFRRFHDESNTCSVCGPGNEAIRVFDWTHFESWPEDVQLSCTGECSTTDGWRLRETFFDSGVDHGREAELTWKWPVELIREEATLKVDFTIYCQSQFTGHLCDFVVTDLGRKSETLADSSSFALPLEQTHEMKLTGKGIHFLEFAFTKHHDTNRTLGASAGGIDESDRHKAHRVAVSAILLTGAERGGASDCTPCSDGHVSSGAENEVCTPCEPGFGANEAGTACVQCPANTFRPVDATHGCLPCPHGTTSEPGATSCDDHGCTYTSTLDGRAVTYDLSSLKSTKFYGPLFNGDHRFELNVCSTEHVDSTECHDADGEPIAAYACQVLEEGLGVSLGTRIGYYDIDTTSMSPPNAHVDDSKGGLIVEYSAGDVRLCTADFLDELDNDRPRSTTITFVCDPSAGRGNPAGCADGIEQEICRYCFTWETALACPVCTEDDYAAVYGDCRDGMRLKLYQWKDTRHCNPLSPLSVALPAAEQVDCEQNSDVRCKAGEHLPPGTTKCLPCDEGYYMPLGGEVLYTSFVNTLNVFQVNGFQFDQDVLQSVAVSGDATVRARYKFVAEKCALKFSASMLDVRTMQANEGEDGKLAKLEFAVYTTRTGMAAEGADEKLVYQHVLFDANESAHARRVETEGSDQTATVGTLTVSGANEFDPLSVGLVTASFEFDLDELTSPHVVFEWRLVNAAGQHTADAKLFGMSVTGIEFAAPSCQACPSGTIASETGAEQCDTCPVNTFANAKTGATTCTPCPEGAFAFAGTAEKCINKHPTGTQESVVCSMDEATTQQYLDYTVLSSACDGASDQRGMQAVSLAPYRCERFDDSLTDLADVPCAPCAPGLRRDKSTGVCTFPCDVASEYLDRQTQTCTQVPDNMVRVGLRTFWIDDSNDLDNGEDDEGSTADGGGEDGETDLPPLPTSWTTACASLGHTSGQCSGGWRNLGRVADSGWHGADYVESVLSTKLLLNLKGQQPQGLALNFTLQLFDLAESGFTPTVAVVLYANHVALKSYTAPGTVHESLVLSGDELAAVCEIDLASLPACAVHLSWRYRQQRVDVPQAGDNMALHNRRARLSDIKIEAPRFGYFYDVAACGAGQFAQKDAGEEAIGEYCEWCPAGTASSNGMGCEPCPVNHYAPRGSATCVPCPQGSYAIEEGSPTCVPMCAFETPGARYNVTTFLDNNANLVFGSRGAGSFQFNLCTPLANPCDSDNVVLADCDLESRDRNTDPLCTAHNSLGIYKDLEGRCMSLGTSFDIEFLPCATNNDMMAVAPGSPAAAAGVSPSTSPATASMGQAPTFGMTNMDEAPDKQILNAGCTQRNAAGDYFVVNVRGEPTDVCPRGIRTKVQFVCDPTGGDVWPTFVEAHDACEHTVLWSSIAACPVCEHADLELQVHCLEEEAAIAEDVTYDYSFEPKFGVACVHSGGKHRALTDDEKSQAEKECASGWASQIAFPLWVPITGAIIFGACLLCSCFMWIKNRKLKHKYVSLENSIGTTMVELEDD